MNKKKWVILDRDGTIIEEKNYLRRPEQVALLPGAAEGLRLLCERGYVLTVVTNQSGVGRGYFTMDDVDRVHCRLTELLAERALRKPVAIRSIGQVKFFRPLQPGDSGVFTLTVEGSRLSGSVATGPGERVCKFTMELEMK